MPLRTLVIVLLLVGTGTGVAQQKKSETPNPRPKPTIADYSYGKDSQRQKLDFWQAKSAKPTPVVMIIHGGAWKVGDKGGYKRDSIQPFLDAGISVAAINYRFIAQAMEQHVEPPVKACLLDAARALQTLRYRAMKWNIDPTRIGTTGTSAGACTSLWLALHDDLAKPDSGDPVERESTRLTCAAVIGRKRRSIQRKFANGFQTRCMAATRSVSRKKAAIGRRSSNCLRPTATNYCLGSRSIRRSST